MLYFGVPHDMTSYCSDQTQTQAHLGPCGNRNERPSVVTEHSIVLEVSEDIRAWIVVLACPPVDRLARVSRLPKDIDMLRAQVFADKILAILCIELQDQSHKPWTRWRECAEDEVCCHVCFVLGVLHRQLEADEAEVIFKFCHLIKICISISTFRLQSLSAKAFRRKQKFQES